MPNKQITILHILERHPRYGRKWAVWGQSTQSTQVPQTKALFHKTRARRYGAHAVVREPKRTTKDATGAQSPNEAGTSDRLLLATPRDDL